MEILVLTWLVKTKRTLTIKELSIAVAIEPGRYELGELDLPDKATILDVCAGLVVIDETSNTFKLAHYTIQEYLLRKSIIFENADFTIAVACITYLMFDIFAESACNSEASLEARFKDQPFIQYAARNL